MPVYSSSEELLQNLQILFKRIAEQDPAATRSVAAARLVIRLACTDPDLELTINGRAQPVQVTYGASKLRPELDIQLRADALHLILMGELTLTKALGSGSLKVKGPVWKTTVLEDVFHRGQAIYPALLRERGFLP